MPLRPVCLAGCGVVAAIVAACGAPAEAPGPLAPPSDPRAVLRLGVDLPRVQRCEETFDLALYQHRGVELVVWDEPAGRCDGRVISVRYLPRRISPKDLQALVASLAARAEILPNESEKRP